MKEFTFKQAQLFLMEDCFHSVLHYFEDDIILLTEFYSFTDYIICGFIKKTTLQELIKKTQLSVRLTSYDNRECYEFYL